MSLSKPLSPHPRVCSCWIARLRLPAAVSNLGSVCPRYVIPLQRSNWAGAEEEAAAAEAAGAAGANAGEVMANAPLGTQTAVVSNRKRRLAAPVPRLARSGTHGGAHSYLPQQVHFDTGKQAHQGACAFLLCAMYTRCSCLYTAQFMRALTVAFLTNTRPHLQRRCHTHILPCGLGVPHASSTGMGNNNPGGWQVQHKECVCMNLRYAVMKCSSCCCAHSIDVLRSWLVLAVSACSTSRSTFASSDTADRLHCGLGWQRRLPLRLPLPLLDSSSSSHATSISAAAVSATAAAAAAVALSAVLSITAAAVLAAAGSPLAAPLFRFSAAVATAGLHMASFLMSLTFNTDTASAKSAADAAASVLQPALRSGQWVSLMQPMPPSMYLRFASYLSAKLHRQFLLFNCFCCVDCGCPILYGL